MESIQLICPFCNATIMADTSNTEIVCNYCGKAITFGQNKIDDANGLPQEHVPAPDPELIAEHKEKEKKWKQNCIIFSVIKAILSLSVWLIVFSRFNMVFFTLAFIASLTMFILLPLKLASMQPDGSDIPNANIKKPSKFKLSLEIYILYFFISVISFFIGALLLINE